MCCNSFGTVGRKLLFSGTRWQIVFVALLSAGLFEKHGVSGVAERAFRRHYGQVYRYLRRRTRDHERAEDLAQQVFAEAVVGLRESGSAELAWLYTVAKRRFSDELRRDAVARRIGALEMVSVEQSREYGSEVAAGLRRALERLPEGQRQVVVLKLLRGLPFAEIATQVDVSVEAAKMRFLRALETVREELEREGVGP